MLRPARNPLQPGLLSAPLDPLQPGQGSHDGNYNDERNNLARPGAPNPVLPIGGGMGQHMALAGSGDRPIGPLPRLSLRDDMKDIAPMPGTSPGPLDTAINTQPVVMPGAAYKKGGKVKVKAAKPRGWGLARVKKGKSK